MIRFLLTTLALVLTGGSLAQSQNPFSFDTSGPASSAEVVSVETRLSHDAAEPGGAIDVAVLLDVADTWHINAHQPLQDFLIGTAVTLDPNPGLILADVRYPNPHLATFAFADEAMAVYEGRVPIFLSIRISEAITPGTHVLEGRLRVQACDDQVCLQPSSIPLSIDIPVSDGSVAALPINEELFAAYDPAASVAGGEIAALFNERGFMVAFLILFLVGLALNLTPCVYPMLSVTISLFGGQEASSTGRAFGRASIYVLGIVTMFSTLGVVTALTGSLFGGWLQSPWLLAGIGVLLLALALSMFGAYELQLPASLTTRLSAANRMGGPVGLYLSGLVVGVFAAPCIGAPIIALLAFVGASGDPLFGFFAFSILALGLGLPYLLLGTFSSLLSRLPKSGLWMVWVKKVFGVVLVGAGLFYLGLALWPAHAPYVIPITLIGGGLYLGFLERSGRGRPVFQGVKWTLGAAVIVAGIMAFMGLHRPGVEWQPYSAEQVELARAEGRPVLLDFYADWCIPCIEMDRVTFTNTRVISATKPFVRLKVDMTYFDSPEAEALRRSFEVAGVPTFVFLNEQGEEVRQARVVGFMRPEAFLERVSKVVPRDVALSKTEG